MSSCLNNCNRISPQNNSHLTQNISEVCECSSPFPCIDFVIQCKEVLQQYLKVKDSYKALTYLQCPTIRREISNRVIQERSSLILLALLEA